MVKNGRYGPYVSHDGVNATLTGDMTPDTVTLEQAVGLLDARAAALGNTPTAARAGRKTGLRQGRGQAAARSRGRRQEGRRAEGEEAGQRPPPRPSPRAAPRPPSSWRTLFRSLHYICDARPLWRRNIYFE